MSAQPWVALSGSPATLDADGWPTEDAYLILFDAAPWEGDPEPYVPDDFFGDYSVQFTGTADLVLDPVLNVTLSNATFDQGTFTTRFVLTLHRSALPYAQSPPGLAIGFQNSRRTPSDPPGSGVTGLVVLQPGFSVWGPPPPVFTPAFLSAVAPLSQLRLMEALDTNGVIAYPQTLEWADRRLPTDALWGFPGNPRPSFPISGLPWEAVVVLALSAAPTLGLWVNFHVACTDDYVSSAAALLAMGNAVTGGRGLPAGSTLYVEHGNELWLNGTIGGPDASYLWNRAAAVAEVAAGGSPLNNDGETNPEVWAARRHLLRLRTLSGLLRAAFAGTGVEVRVVYAWMQDYVADARAALAWAAATWPSEPPSSWLYGFAVNGYVLAYPGPGWTQEDVISAILLGSDSARPARDASAALVGEYNLTALLAYEGMVAALPGDGNGDNATWAVILETMRSELIGPALKYDIEANWAPLPRAGPFNFYALCSPYAPYPVMTWGLSEDVANTTTPKWMAVKQMLGAAAAAAAAAAGREGGEGEGRL